MTLQEKKEQYARLIIRVGVSVREGQVVYVRCPLEEYEFGRMIAAEAYSAGAKNVIFTWNDDKLARLKYDNAPLEVFENYPEWDALMLNTLATTDACFISIVGSDPEALKGADTAKLKAARVALNEKCKPYRKAISTMGVKWNVTAIPTKAWASKVFPELPVDEAVNKLWDAVFGTVRIGDGDPVEKWMQHAAELKEKHTKLTSWQLKSLHYKNSLGTDFTVGIVENHRWEGGADSDPVNGQPFFANMPTEEVFTMPHREKAEGVLVSSLPLSYEGNLIKDFKLTFKNGEVVDYEAKEGEEYLKLLLETDEGSRHLGEVALVPYPCPVSEQGIMFLETLFDENAACHFALGHCYETNLVGGADMSEEEVKAKGGNFSINHVDFMVGTKDLLVTGITKDGEEVTIFKDGTWAF